MAQKKYSHFGPKFVKCEYVYNGTDSSGVANSTVAAHGTGIIVASGTLVTRGYIVVNTTFTSSTDAATIAAKIEGAGDLVAATAISDTRNIWDAGNKGTLLTAPNLGADSAHDSQVEVVDLFGALPILTTAERELTVTVASEALTAGKFTIYLECWS